MKLLFWNLHKKNNSVYINDLLHEADIDVAVFSEYKEPMFSEECSLLSDYCMQPVVGGDQKIVMIHKKDKIKVEEQWEQSRYTLYQIRIKENSIIHVAGIHLGARQSASFADHLENIRDLIVDIEILEKRNQSFNTLLIGDFNTSPFDNEMIDKTALNAVLFKDVIKSNEIVTHNKLERRRFYNPMLNLFSEENKVYGSYYYGSKSDTLYWYFYDQVICRKELMYRIKSIYYCKKINGNSLLTPGGYPKTSISDHLPLIVEVRL